MIAGIASLVPPALRASAAAEALGLGEVAGHSPASLYLLAGDGTATVSPTVFDAVAGAAALALGGLAYQSNIKAAKATADLEELQNAIGSAGGVAQTLSVALQDKEEELQREKTGMAGLKGDIDAANQALAETQAKLDESKSMASLLEGELTRARVAMQQAAENSDGAGAELAAAREAARAAEAALEAAGAEMERRLEEQASALSASKAVAGVAAGEASELHKRLSAQKKLLVAAAAAEEEARVKVTKLGEELLAARDKVTLLGQELHQAQAASEVAQADSEAAMSKLHDERVQSEVVEKARAAAVKDTMAMMSKIRDLEFQLSDAIGRAQAAEAGEGGEGAGGGEGDVSIAQVAPGEHYGDMPAGGGKKPTARVVGIIQRNWRSRGYCGSLQPPGKNARPLTAGHQNSVLFVPVERKFPRVRIQTRQAEHLMDKRIVVTLDGWEADSEYPSGHYVRTLGTIGDKETETEVLVIEHDVNTSPFTVAVHQCVPALPWSVGDEDRADPNRIDLREYNICSVDPPGCRDIDDALHVRELPNGNLEVGVHIADVTNFVHSGAPIDLEASRRGTSVYLVQRRIDMLPKPLTEDICSLRADVERLAFSVLWEMTPEADVVGVKYSKSIIKSKAAMSYLEAQTRMDDPKVNDPITKSLREMNRIAKILRKRRGDAGALTLASPEVRFELDTETHDPMDVGMYQVREANQMVEEMMLLANCTVAGKIVAHFASCAMLRRHPTPTPRMFEPLMRAAASVGVEIDPSSSRTLAESLDKAQGKDPYFNKLIRIMATRCMTQALYFGSGECAPHEYHHYGLAAPLYTHFTSPIRRYADVIVHRLLAAAIGLIPLPEGLRDKAGLKALTTELNYRHRNAQQAGRASVELHTLIFFRKRQVVADARITRVRKNGLILFVPKYGIEGPVYLTSKDANAAEAAEWELDEEAQAVHSKSTGVRYKIFDAVAVRICVEQLPGHRQRLSVTLAPGETPEEKCTDPPKSLG